MRYSYELWIFWRKLAMGWVSTLACGKVTCVHLPNVVLWPCQGRALRLIMCLLISIQEYTCEQNHLASPLCWLERFVQEYLADEYYVPITALLGKSMLSVWWLCLVSTGSGSMFRSCTDVNLGGIWRCSTFSSSGSWYEISLTYSLLSIFHFLLAIPVQFFRVSSEFRV